MRSTVLMVSLATALLGCGDNLTHPGGRDDYDGGTTPPLTCVPNLDGQIDASELTAALGVPVSYLVSPPGKESPVDLEGQVGEGGERVWDWSVDVASDQKATLEASALAGKWFASSFPTGEFVTSIDAGGTIQGIYRHDDEALHLLGVASATEAPAEGKTLLVYDVAIALYRFPLTKGAAWVSTGHVENGMIRGLPYAGTDTYEVTDDATGKLVLPSYTFTQVHRVRTRALIAPSAGAATFTRQVSYFFECFGEVARATSKNDEPNEIFTTASEIRRFGQ